LSVPGDSRARNASTPGAQRVALRLLLSSSMRSQLASIICLTFAACGGGHDATPDAPVTPPDSTDTNAVTFSYTPSWDGVTAVDVIGGFGQAGDWTTPIASLTNTGSGAWTATVPLPAGQYVYLFHVTGDAAAGSASATLARYVIDPEVSGYVPCPTTSPTYSVEMNPCTQLTVPVVAPTTAHVTGRVLVDGAPAASYIIVFEREEATTHHFFANRTTTGTDGTYDFVAAAGSYRVQIQHPDYLAKTDAHLDPVALARLRRIISGKFAVSPDVAVPDVDMAFHDYALFTPTPSAQLPTAFTFTSGTNAKLDVYGGGMEIGDPWYASDATKTGGSMFTGTFNTPKATTQDAMMGTRYWWGIEQPRPAGTGGISWTYQTMVFPITWSAGT
jgi:hypothetical protein